MAVLKKIKFTSGGETYNIAQTVVTAEEGKALTVKGTNTGLNDEGDPTYAIALAVDGKTILDTNSALSTGLKLAYVKAVAATTDTEAKEAHIALTDNDGTELTTVNISEIIGGGIVDTSSYSETTGKLTINFIGGATSEVDLGKLLDIDDVAIAGDSKDYLDVKLNASASETGGSQAQFSAKIGKMADVKAADDTAGTAAVTGLADALDVKTYVDSQIVAKNVSAEGDDYVGASAADNKVTVATNVKDLTATAGTVGVYDTTTGAQTTAPTDGSLSGTAKSLADASNIATSVKTYVDGQVAIETARADAAIKAAIYVLDSEAQGSDTDSHVTVKVKEEHGKLTEVTVTTSDIASAGDLSKVASAVGLDSTKLTYSNDGNYTGSADTSVTTHTVTSDIAALDKQLKTVSDTVSGVTYNVDGTTLVFGSGLTKDATLKAETA